MAPQSPHLYCRIAELLRCAANAYPSADPSSEWREAALAALEEFDRHEYAIDEPLFVLRGRDPLAEVAVKHWGARAYIAKVNPDKVSGALEVADRMALVANRRLPS